MDGGEHIDIHIIVVPSSMIVQVYPVSVLEIVEGYDSLIGGCPIHITEGIEIVVESAGAGREAQCILAEGQDGEAESCGEGRCIGDGTPFRHL